MRFVAPVLLLAGVGLVAYAVVTGSASVALWAIVPVVHGSSAPFLVGVVLLLLGFFALPLGSFLGSEDGPSADEAPTPGAGSARGAGVVLVGPVPIFFGAWRSAPDWIRWAIALAVGAAMLVLLVIAWQLV